MINMASILRAWNILVGKARKLTSTSFGLNEALHTVQLDSEGRDPSDPDYTGPVVQQTVLKIITDDIVYADLTADVYTFADDVDGVAIINDGAANLTITVDTKTFTIKAGESRVIEPENAFDTATLSALATFRMNGLRRS